MRLNSLFKERRNILHSPPKTTSMPRLKFSVRLKSDGIDSYHYLHLIHGQVLATQNSPRISVTAIADLKARNCPTIPYAIVNWQTALVTPSRVDDINTEMHSCNLR